MDDLERIYDFFTDFSGIDDSWVETYINTITKETAVFFLDGGEACLNDKPFDDSDELREKIETEPGWVEMPSKYDLNLGSRVPLNFAEDNLSPEDCDLVYNYFRHPGAYSNFKALLDRLDKIDDWYRFEEEVTREKLQEWLTYADMDEDEDEDEE